MIELFMSHNKKVHFRLINQRSQSNYNIVAINSHSIKIVFSNLRILCRNKNLFNNQRSLKMKDISRS